ncbi:MAG: UDP-glucose 4-epimerase GalE [Cytophagales bacterium]|nr:UDP-glucose 4-epimerase GalE [Cytophagales bacterium]
MSSKKILVTGGAGYIGSHTVRLLANSGYNVIVLDNLVYGHREAIVNTEVELIVGDLGDQDLTARLFEYHDIEAVIHFAAYAYVNESVTDPEKYYKNNVAASLNLLEIMRKKQCLKFIFSSTCATYGNPQYVPIDEKHPQNPINPYGMSKLMLEKILIDYEKAYNFKYAFLRYFNASGASEDGILGEDHNPETHLIPLILDAVTGDRPHITVFGTDYDTPDGTCIRDYIHVLDLASAHLASLKYLSDGGLSHICNLGTGKGVSVKEMIKVVEAVTGKSVPVVFGPRRAGDPPYLYANAAQAKEILGWQAQYTDVKDIVTHAWNWKTGNKGGKY